MGNLASSTRRFFSSFDQRGLNTIPNNTRELAWFAQSTYQSRPPTEHRGYELDFNLRTVKVWVNDDTKQIVFAVRGTQGETDIKTDIKLAISKETETQRYKVARNALLQVLKEYPDYKIVLTGHSLGGGIVYRLADEFQGLTGEVFNPAVNLTTIHNKQHTSRRVKTHIIDGDPVAGIAGRPLDNTQVYTPAYGTEREQIMKMPTEQRLRHLHAIKRFPMI